MAEKDTENKYPTLFVFNGHIMHYDEGSMLELHSLVTTEEWEQIVEETVKYKIFVECLKNVAYPALDEVWSEDENWYQNQLEVSVARIRNIDPLILAKWNEDSIKQSYISSMSKGVKEVKHLINEVKQDIRTAKITRISGF